LFLKGFTAKIKTNLEQNNLKIALKKKIEKNFFRKKKHFFSSKSFEKKNLLMGNWTSQKSKPSKLLECVEPTFVKSRARKKILKVSFPKVLQICFPPLQNFFSSFGEVKKKKKHRQFSAFVVT
jgi:hypothetical protein